MNESIWNAMLSAESRNGCLIKRYVSIRNFEHAHNYKHDSKKGKPLSAFEFAKNIDFDDDSISIVNHIKKIVGVLERDITFDQDYLEGNVKEPF